MVISGVGIGREWEGWLYTWANLDGF